MKVENLDLKIVKDFIEDYFDYTITISITESEWLDNFSWLEDYFDYEDDDTMRKLYHKEALKDLLYDLVYNQENIKKQLEIDLDTYGNDSEEYKYIKEFYCKWKDIFNFKLEKLKND